MSSVFVRRGRKGTAEIGLLDHGLYDTLKEPHRQALCQLYKAIIMKDDDAMDLNSERLGVKGKDDLESY